MQDCWHKNYEGAPEDGSAWEVQRGGNCRQRVLRGGSWNDRPMNLRSAYRYRYNADNRSLNIGFRLAQDL